MTERRTRRSFTQEFKAQTVKRLLEGGCRRWRRNSALAPGSSASGAH